MENTQKITNLTAFLMIAFAMIIDLTQLILTTFILGTYVVPIITLITTIIFWIWFSLLKIPLTHHPKQLATISVSSLGELIPLVDVLPLWTIGTIIMVVMMKKK
ncbi:MAG: hypothetical protein WAV11_03370 [Minisyncoccia bacterium]